MKRVLTLFLCFCALSACQHAFAAAKVSVVAGANASEPNTSGSFTFSRTAVGLDTTVVIFYTVTGTAVGGTDYVTMSGSVTLGRNVKNVSVPVVPIDDLIFEATETIIVTITPNAAYNIDNGASTATINLLDNEAPPVVQFTTVASSGNESTTAPTSLIVSLSTSAGVNVSVNYAVNAAGTTALASDYSLPAGTLTFLPGQTTKTIPLTITNDAVPEIDKNVQVILSAPVNSTLGANTTHTYTIIDDDFPSVQFSTASSSGNESVSPNLTVTLSAAPVKVATVNYTVTGGTATNGTDYTLASGTLTFNPGVASQTIPVAVINDLLDEFDETIQVTLSAPTNATLGVNTVHTYTILDDDPPPTVSFTAAASSGSEAVSPANLAVSLSAPSAKTITVNYTVGAGTATGGGVDFTLANGTLTFNPGVTSLNIPISVVNDIIDEPDETVIVSISAPSNATLGAITTHTYTIQDDDLPPLVRFSAASSSGTEAVSPVSIPVTLSAPSAFTITVSYSATGGTATNGSDYSLAAGTLTFAPGVTTQNITMTVAADGINEPNETVDITLSGPTNASLGAPAVHTYTIIDNDVPPQIAFNAASSSGTEATSPALLPVSLSYLSGQIVTVNYNVTGGTATGGGTDYTLAAGTLTFNPGVLTQNISIAVNNDTTPEFNETVIVTLSGPVNGTLGAQTQHTYTIIDDDTPTVQFSAIASSGNENVAAPATLTVVLSAASVFNVTVNYSVSGGTATGGGVDYTLAAGTLTFAPGVVSMNVPLSVVNDVLDEFDETVQVTLAAPTNANLGANTVHTYTILDNDPPPTVAFNAASSSNNESVTAVNLPVSLSGASGKTVTVNYSVTGGTATGGGVDYTLAAGTLTFNPGVTTMNIPLSVVNDTITEPNETVIVTLAGPVDASLGAIQTHTYTIVNDDAAPTVAFDSATLAGTEVVANPNIAVSLSNPSAFTVTVNYAVTGGTATGGGTDYTLAAGTLTFNPGVTTRNIVPTVVDDGLAEATETIVITLSAPVNGTLGATTVHTYSIIDDDPPPSVSFNAATSSGSEATPSVNVPVSLSFLSGQTVSVAYSVTGGTATGGGVDYTLAAGSLVFNPGTLTQNIVISVVDDALIEGNETLIITLASPVNASLGATTSHTYTIVDNDVPTVQFTLAGSSGNESVTAVNLQVSLSQAFTQVVTVNYAISGGTASGGGVDYTLAAGTLNFNPGVTTQNVPLTVVNDTLDEYDESVLVTLSGPVNAILGANVTHTYTILDDDPAPLVAFTSAASSVGEAAGSVNLAVSLSAVSDKTITVDYAVTGGSATGGGVDYTLASGSLTFFPGDLTKNISVSIANDALDEFDETVIVTLSNAVDATLGANNPHTLTILDDDPLPTVQFLLASSSGSESVAVVNLTVTLSAPSGRPVTVDYSATGGTATGGGVDYTLVPNTLTFAPGVTSQNVVFSVVDDGAGEGDETIAISLSNPVNTALGANAAHTYTIFDDDIYIISRETQDFDGDGFIDRIRIVTSVALDDMFGGLNVTVAGYTVSGYDTGTANDNEFFVLINEGGVPDTGATPGVRVVSNLSLRKFGSPQLIPTDAAAVTATDAAKPVLIRAELIDASGGGVSAFDTMILTFSETVSTTAMVVGDIGLPVVNDTLDTSTIADQGPATTVNVTLLGNPRLTPGGTYSPGSLANGSPTGVYINDGIHIFDISGNNALNQTVGTAVDLQPGNVILAIAWDDLTITPKVWTFSTDFNTTSNASAAFPPSGLIVRNVGNVRVQIAVSCSATTVPSGWTLGATAGSSIFETKLVDGALVQDLSTGPKTLVTGLYSGFQKPFDIRFVSPTAIPDSDLDVTQTFTVLLVATQN